MEAQASRRMGFGHSGRRVFRLALAASLISGAALLIGTLPSLASSPKLAYPAAKITDLPDNSGTGTGTTPSGVKCPAAHPHPVGGGVDIEGVDPNLDLEVHTSAPVGNAWHVVGNNNSGNDAQMTTYAICALGDVVYPSKTVPIGPGGTKAIKVSCPLGRKVVGGGVQIIGGDHTNEVGSSEPADGKDADHKIGDAWFGTGGNGTPGTVHLKVTAICAKGGTYVIRVSPRTSVPNNAIGTAGVLCPNGSRVTGGGTDIDGQSTDLELHDGFPVDGPDANLVHDNGWQSTVYNDGSGHLHHMKTFAICQRS